MRYFDKLLEKIDTYYEDKSQKDILYTYIMAAGFFAFISWAFFLDPTKASYDKAKTERTRVVNAITLDENYLKNFDSNTLMSLQMQTAQLKNEFIAIKKNSDYIDYKISQLKPLIYNATAWGNFIDSISDIARQHNVQLLKLHNNFVKKSQEFGHVLDIELDISASFHNSLRFINALEKTSLVVDIHELKMFSTDRLKTHLKVAVWGINY